MRAEIHARGLAVPLKTCDGIDVAELASVDALLQLLQHRHEAAPETDLQRQRSISRQPGRLFCLGRDDAEWLLAQDRQSGGDQPADRLEVEVARGADEDAVQTAGFEHRL